jgi:hypothetical protein
MRTVSFEIPDEDFQVLNAIARRFYGETTRGGRLLDISDLARFNLLEQKEKMAWVIQPPKPPSNVLHGPWVLAKTR